ncbi:MAG TPA: HDIG domain-containing metalloprotein [Geobacteraceae bacterium]
MPSTSSDNDTSGKGPLLILWRSFQDVLSRRFSSGKHEKRDRFLLLFLTAGLITYLILPDQSFLAVRYRVGEVATSDVRAPRDFLLEDSKLTEKKRREAEAAVQTVYDLHSDMTAVLLQRLGQGLALVSEAKSQAKAVDRDALRATLKPLLGGEVSNEELNALARLKERPFLAEAGRLVSHVYERKIVADRQAFAADKVHGITILDAETGQPLGGSDEAIAAIDLTEARGLFARAKLEAGGEPRDLEVARDILEQMLRPNLIYNRARSEELRQAARSAVNPVLLQIKRGEMIVRVGERITADHEQKLAALFADRPLFVRLFTGVGILGLILLLLYFPYRFARKNIRKFNPSYKDIFFLALITIGNFILLKITHSVSAVLGGAFPNIETSSYYYLFPFAASAIVVRIVLNSEVALVYCAICAPMIGIMFENNLQVVIYAMLGGIVGAHGVRHCKDRGTIYTAGLKVSVVNLAMVLSFQVFGDSLFSIQTFYAALFAAISGLFSAACVSGAIPLVESLFQYTTDIKLLELSNLNTPILRDLMVRAPGTYHHSVLVGNMVESAAEAISANPLLARVAAYYHDIGKVSKPLYFVENQGGGENRHDRLSPSMSALILISHVKEGVELARQQRVGQPIVDIIRQSHGTALIRFFYQKAQEQAGSDQVVAEKDFRYPGPKPQTREAGLVLLADAVEAASRTLTDPTPARIQGLAQKIINNIFIDGQLDECELTLKNLHEIAKSFNQILIGIYHQRIDYPEPAYKEKSAGGRKQSDHSNHEPPKAVAGRDEKAKKGSPDDLKRLGMSH